MKDIETNFTITSLQANLYAIPLAIFIIAALYIPFILIWSVTPLMKVLYSPFISLKVFLPVFILLALLYEIIHWLAFRWAGKIDATHLKIGFQWKTLTPYAHCDASMPAYAYRISLILPALLLGIIPSIVALIFGISWLLIYGIIFTIVGGGDFIILWLIRKVKKDQLLQDHPSRCGCKAIDNLQD